MADVEPIMHGGKQVGAVIDYGDERGFSLVHRGNVVKTDVGVAEIYLLKDHLEATGELPADPADGGEKPQENPGWDGRPFNERIGDFGPGGKGRRKSTTDASGNDKRSFLERMRDR